MLAAILLFVGIASRLIVHEPNFTPVMALALFGGLYLPKRTALIVPLLMMIVTDLVLGLHDTVLLTWGSVLMISALGVWLRERKSMVNLLGSSFLSAGIFFVITNFGAWLTMYPQTMEGLRQCYLLAIPFFRMTLMSTVVYAVVFIALYESLASFFKETRYAKALLSS